MTEKEDLTKVNVRNVKKAVMCPDGSVECSDGQTCCQTADSSYRCCQYAMVSLQPTIMFMNKFLKKSYYN